MSKSILAGFALFLLILALVGSRESQADGFIGGWLKLRTSRHRYSSSGDLECETKLLEPGAAGDSRYWSPTATPRRFGESSVYVGSIVEALPQFLDREPELYRYLAARQRNFSVINYPFSDEIRVEFRLISKDVLDIDRRYSRTGSSGGDLFKVRISPHGARAYIGDSEENDDNNRAFYDLSSSRDDFPFVRQGEGRDVGSILFDTGDLLSILKVYKARGYVFWPSEEDI